MVGVAHIPNAGSFRYYCEIHGGPNGTGMSGIVNVNPTPYARPKGASPSNIRLVPAYKPCSSANMSHGAPLNVGSCGPPVPESSYATVGSPDTNGAAANSVGVINFKVVGEQPIDPNNGDQADVQISASITDVRSKANPANDYAGQLRGLPRFASPIARTAPASVTRPPRWRSRSRSRCRAQRTAIRRSARAATSQRRRMP